MSHQNDVTLHFLDSDGRLMTEKTVTCSSEDFNVEAMAKLIAQNVPTDTQDDRGDSDHGGGKGSHDKNVSS